MNIPENIKYVLNKLNNHNYEAYIVGGCVRDFLLHKNPVDFDITTNALPNEIKEVFNDLKIIDNNGEKHGTVTIRYNHTNIEITTFRTDGNYLDHRHPDNVAFTRNLEEDLSRRDFTINAMAMDINGDIYDYHFGKEDLSNRIIKCVGEPHKRFEEDALRILRALRFASTLEFDIDEETINAMYELRNTLSYVSKERIKSEFDKMICGKSFTKLAKDKRIREVLAEIIPELALTFDFDQKSIYHTNDLYLHTLSVVENVIPNHIVKIAALLHDIGKTKCYQPYIKDGIEHYHFIGHPLVSKEMAEVILNRLRYSHDEITKILFLIEYHDYHFSDKLKSMRKFMINLPKFDSDNLIEYLISLKKADRIDHNVTEEFDFDIIRKNYHLIKDNPLECYNLKSLNIKGNDLLKLGYEGKIIGEILNDALSKVVDGKLSNEKDSLILYIIKEYKQSWLN